ncbi:MAG: oligoendopeptidase F [Herpetosiphonaceae bacterium]|nr:MAG: oligoendopeptidase F [Herpetosiphonaceae bacterium]
MIPSTTAIKPDDWASLDAAYTSLAEVDLSPDTICEWIQQWSDIEKMLEEATALNYWKLSANTNDPEVQKHYTYFWTEIMAKAMCAAHTLKKKLLACHWYQPSPEHVEMIRRMKVEVDLFSEENAAIQSTIYARSQEFLAIIAAQTVTLGGQELTVPEAEQRLYAQDRSQRESAWRAIAARKLQDRDAIDSLMLELFVMRQNMARNSNLPNFRAHRWLDLKRFDYTPEDCLSLHESIIAEFVPLWCSIQEQRKKNLELDTLRPWDLVADPCGLPPLRPFQTVEELMDGVGRICTRIDPAIGEHFTWLRNNNYLDLEPRKNKAAGGFFYFLGQRGNGYIFYNAVGNHQDTIALLHELGHAFHFYEAHQAQELYWNVHQIPWEMIELPSLSMELLATPYLTRKEGGFYDSNEDAGRAILDELEFAIGSMLRTSLSDAFQHWLYTQDAEDLKSSDLYRAWDQLVQRFFPIVDWSGFEDIRAAGWQTKHIVTHPFYSIEYVIAQLGAFQIWKNAQHNEAETIRNLRRAHRLGASRPLPDLYEAAGIRFSLDREIVKELANYLELRLYEVMR